MANIDLHTMWNGSLCTISMQISFASYIRHFEYSLSAQHGICAQRYATIPVNTCWIVSRPESLGAYTLCHFDSIKLCLSFVAESFHNPIQLNWQVFVPWFWHCIGWLIYLSVFVAMIRLLNCVARTIVRLVVQQVYFGEQDQSIGLMTHTHTSKRARALMQTNHCGSVIWHRIYYHSNNGVLCARTHTTMNRVRIETSVTHNILAARHWSWQRKELRLSFVICRMANKTTVWIIVVPVRLFMCVHSCVCLPGTDT